MIYEINKWPLNIDYSKPIFCDTETKGFYGQVRLFQLYQEHWDKAVIIDFDRTDVSLIDVYDVIRKGKVVFHNISYDWATLVDNLGSFVHFDDWEDTFLLSRQALYFLTEFSLDAIMKYIYKKDMYAPAGDKKRLQKSSWEGELTPEQYLYAAIDVYYLPKVYHAVKSASDKFVVKLDKAVIPYIQKWQKNGLIIDQSELQKAIDGAEQKIEEARAILPKGFNPRSYVQVRRLFNSDASDDMFLSLVISSDKYTEEQKTYARAIRQMRKYYKQLDTFLRKWEGNDRIYGHFAPTTISGRLACDELNLLNIPRGLKKVFGFENKDSYFVFADFAQLELRTLCADLGDPVLERLFKQDEDLHIYAAKNIFPGEEIDDHKRFIGKTANFGLAYGAGANRFKDMVLKQSGIILSEDFARRVVRNWKNLYPEIKKWHQKNARKRGSDLIDSTLSGRLYRARNYTDLNAIRNQGTGAEVFKLTLHYLNKKGVTSIMDAIHDSFLLEAKTFEEAKELAHVLADTMVEAWFEVTKQAKIKDLPMPTTASVGYSWKHADSGEPLYSYTNKGVKSGI